MFFLNYGAKNIKNTETIYSEFVKLALLEGTTYN